MPMILEVRTYRLHPGTRQEFLRAMTEEAGPREAIVTPIVQYHSIAVETPAAVVEGMRRPL
jgi:hypothetical protein